MRPQEVQSDNPIDAKPKASTPQRSWRPFLIPEKQTNNPKKENEREESG
jgi:hypothetical protein